RYFVEREDVLMEAGQEATFVDDDDNPVFIAKRRFSLPISPPSDAQLTLLGQGAQGRMLPFPRLPWVEREDLELKVDYTLENRSDRTVTALVFVDGVNEFNAYAPGVEDFHQWERRFELSAGELVTGVITELEMDEIAIDLATVVNGALNSNLVVHFESQSGSD